MEIKAKATYDRKTINALVKTILKRTPIVILRVFMALLIAMTYLVNVSDIISTGEFVAGNFIFPVLMTVFWVWFIHVFFPKTQYENIKRKSPIENDYVFYDDHLKDISYSQGINATAEYQYDALVEVIETEGYFYLFISKGQVVVVDKSTVTDGTSEEIRAVISAVVGTKNYKCKV